MDGKNHAAMEVDKLRELFSDIDVNVENLTDEQVIDVAQTIIASTIQLAKLYTQFVMDSMDALKEAAAKLAEVKRGEYGSESSTE